MEHNNISSLIEQLVDGLDLNDFYSFIDSKTDIEKNTPELVFQYTTWSALFNGIIRSNEEDDKKVHIENLVVESSEYAGVREHVILNFANFLSKFEVDNLYLQNPPVQISDQMIRLFAANIEYQQYRTIDEAAIKQINTEFDLQIYGQNEANFTVRTYRSQCVPQTSVSYSSNILHSYVRSPLYHGCNQQTDMVRSIRIHYRWILLRYGFVLHIVTSHMMHTFQFLKERGA